MSKGLKALNNIRELINRVEYASKIPNINNELDTIENSLKEYELMKQTKIIVANKNISQEDLEKLKNQRMFVGSLEQREIKPLFDEETQKKLKALEIIKEHIVIGCDEETKLLTIYEKIDDENLKVIYVTHNKEKYDLLKEVLCD